MSDSHPLIQKYDPPGEFLLSDEESSEEALDYQEIECKFPGCFYSTINGLGRLQRHYLIYHGIKKNTQANSQSLTGPDEIKWFRFRLTHPDLETIPSTYLMKRS